MGSGEASLVEKCYITENSTTDHRILARLERELQSAFHFENGGGQHVISLWVVQILLGLFLLNGRLWVTQSSSMQSFSAVK